jgi:outer membrane autotransporter protein
MDQLSGELHASTQSALLNTSGLVPRTLSQRLRGNLGAGLVAGAPTARAAGAMPAGAMPTSSAYPLWASVVGNWNTLKDNGNAAQVKTDTAGLFLGGDAAVGEGWRVGAALGYTEGRINVDDRSSRSNVKSYTGALYGGRSWASSTGSSLNLLAGAAYTRHGIDSRRTITVGGNQTLKADYTANAVQLFTELGYAMPVGQSSVLEPYAGLAWLNQRSKGFAEEGGVAALQAGSHTDRLTTLTLGLRAKTTLDISGKEATLSGGLGWRHANGDLDPSRRMSFVQASNVTFAATGAPIAKDAAVVDLGAQVALGKQAALGLSYSAQFGKGSVDNSGSLFLRVRF